MRSDRVKYYPTNDFIHGYNLDRVEKINVSDFTKVDINDAIEFYEIKRYFDVGTRLKKWSNEECNIYKERSNNLFGLTMRFFSTINDDNIIEIYNQLELGYTSEFWALFDKCKMSDRISDQVFGELIQCKNIAPHDLFRHKRIVAKYGVVLREYILQHLSCIRILIHVYQQNYNNKEKL